MKMIIIIWIACCLTGCDAYKSYQNMKAKVLSPAEAIGEFQTAMPRFPVSDMTVLNAYRTAIGFGPAGGDCSVVITFSATPARLSSLQREVLVALATTNSWSLTTSPFDIARRDSGLRGQTNWVVPAGSQLIEHKGPGDRYKIVGVDQTNGVIYFYSTTW